MSKLGLITSLPAMGNSWELAKTALINGVRALLRLRCHNEIGCFRGFYVFLVTCRGFIGTLDVAFSTCSWYKTLHTPPTWDLLYST